MPIPSHLQFRFSTSRPLTSHRHVGPVVDRLIERLLPGGGRMVDIGCGNGGSSGRFLDQGHAVTGVDPSAHGIALARETYPRGTWVQASADPGLIGELDVEPFDLALSIEVVEHVYAPRDWARCCFESLRPGGHLICSTPYHGYVKNLALSLADKWDSHQSPLWDGGHIKMWSRATLGRLLAEVGFERPEFHGAGRLPLLWMSMVMCARRPA